MAVVDVNYKFIMIDVGSYGKNSDGGVLEHSEFGKLLYMKKLDLPQPKAIVENSTELFPFVLVGDEAFRLSENLMKPYPRRDLDEMKRRYNYHLSYTRQVVECTFGILTAKFRIFDTNIAIHPTKVDKVIKAACVLHNLIRVEEGDMYNSESIDTAGGAFEPITNICRLNKNQSTRTAREIRDKFCNYFSGAGAEEWQDD
ncbi:hypothetical protein RI129_011227 [Pyrocoelia pectoralis]|uniref:DDE Tnp4 domain-containing protein n=1 Tax=Pyrocoelia pectoralis TaxID=417401 RepID=A0AAN7ZHA6_9COLE